MINSAMQRNLSNITSTTWAQSLNEPGEIVQDIDVIKQRWYLILSTPAGSVPLDPYFSCDIFGFIDQPINIAAPQIRAEILRSTKAYLPELSIKSIKYEVSVDGNISYLISANLNNDIVTFRLITSNGLLSFPDYKGKLVLYNAIPLNAESYTIILTLDNAEIFPSPPVEGFNTVADMLDWCNNNWSLHGTFTAGKDVFVLHAANNHTTGSLKINTL